MELGLAMNKPTGAETSPTIRKTARANAVAFDSAELRAGPTMGQGLYLVVRGPAPDNGAQVKLLPVLGEHDPEFRKIEIVSEDRPAGSDLPQSIEIEHYEKSIPLSGIMGSKGIELIGANQRKKFSLAK